MAQRSRGSGIRPQRAKDRDPRSAGQPRPKQEARPPARRGRQGGKGKDHRHRGIRRGPTDAPASTGRTIFDNFAERVTRVVSSAYFFATCLAGVVAWALFGPPLGFSQTWQLVINTATTIVTFLMVAVLQNSSRRGEKAIQHKLNAIADALADFMEKVDIELEDDVDELEAAVGLEERQGSG